jgi:hypothetical protein
MTRSVEAQMTNTPNGNRTMLNRLRKAGLTAWSIVVIVQWLWWFGKQDYIATFLTIAGGVIGIVIFLRRNLLAEYPISTLMMLGYLSYYFLLPPLATFIEGKSLTNNLDRPALVLLHAFVSLVSLILAHSIYRHWRPAMSIRWFVSRKIYQRFGFFRAPTSFHLLIMGSIGLIAMAVQVFIVGNYKEEVLGFSNKLMQGLYPLAYLPYVILVRKLIGQDGRYDRKWLFILLGFTILISIVSLGMNSRASLYAGVTSIFLAYFYGLAVGFYKGTLWKMVLTIFVVIVISGPTTDLADSMVIARESRSKISAAELVSETIKVFQDKEALNSFQMYGREIGSVSDEWYVDNLFMARLCNLKYADLSIHLALSMGKFTKAYMREIEIQRILINFPRPLIKILGLPVDKDFVGAASSGDFMLYAATGNEYVLGGFRSGSIFGNGFALFGWFYPIVFSLIVMFTFPLADSLTSRISVMPSNQSGSKWVPLFSPMVIIGFFSWFIYLTSAAAGIESLLGLLNYLLRGWIQILVVYVIIYWITYIPLKMITPRIV